MESLTKEPIINEPSVESPFTPLQSDCTVYNSLLSPGTRPIVPHAPRRETDADLTDSLNHTNELKNLTYSGFANSKNSYLSLRAKAKEGQSKYEAQTKAVADALHNLQSKIRKIESDRSKAELNLKCLALETKDYKELLKKKQTLGGDMNKSLTENQSRELETQLLRAQDRCISLETQLENMRKVMQEQVSPKSTKISPMICKTPSSKEGSSQMKFSPKSFNDNTIADTSAIEKLNDLEKEHQKLTATQSQTENKIRKLEERIRKEVCHRKLLQDETKELQTVVVGQKTKIDVTLTPEQPSKKKKRTRGSKGTIPEMKVTLPQSSERQSTSNSSPSHYLVDFSNIPFVVGQSTSKSHSLGANIQSVLSIMKSHNMLCCDASPRSCRRSEAKCKPKQSQLVASCEHLEELLVMLKDEFNQLKDEQHNIATKLEFPSKSKRVLASMQKETKKVSERMDVKGKQIHIISEHLEKVKLGEKENRKGKQKKIKGADFSEISSESKSTSLEVKTNPKLDVYKKVKRIQSTLCKGDLKWV